MTFIELAQAVRARIGIQGSGPSSVTTNIPIEQDMVQAVRDIWIDIQNYRTDWKWMRTDGDFSTVAGTTVYSLATVLDPGYRFSKWRTDVFYITVSGQKSLLNFLEYDKFEYRHANNSTNAKVSEFTVRPWDNALKMTPPDAIYTISGSYQQSAQILSSNTDTPEVPVQFHNLILYGALEKMGVSVLTKEQYEHFSQEYAIGMGQLLRDQLPKKVIKVEGIA